MARGARAVSGEDIPDDLAVDGARDAVLELQVHLGDGVLGEDGGIGDITCIARLVLKRCQSVTMEDMRCGGATYG